MTVAAVIPVGRPTFDLVEAGRLVHEAIDALRRDGVVVVGDEHIATDVAGVDAAIDEILADSIRPDVIVVLQASFADASMIIRVHDRRRLPIVCWSFPEPRTGAGLRLNGLCGANLATYSLRRRDSSAAFVHIDPADCDAASRVRSAIDAASAPLRFELRRPEPPAGTADPIVDRVLARLRDAKIGVIGDHPDGFEPCAYDAEHVGESFGTSIDRVELEDLFSTANGISDGEVAHIRERVERVVDVPPDLHGVDRSMRLYGALRTLTTDREWDAVATRCWPECTRDYGGAICAPQAMLTEDGVPAMCEADVFGGLTALILRELSGGDPFVTDVVDLDRSDGTSAIWHCGQASIGLADPDDHIEGIDHPMQGKALLHQFSLRPGRVTIARITQARGRTAMVIAGGELLDRPRPFVGTCGVLSWDLPVDDVMRTIFDAGLEHHVAVIEGDHRNALVEIAARLGLPVIRLGHDHGTREELTVELQRT